MTTGRFMLSLVLLFVLVFFNPFYIVIISLVEERAGLCAYRAFVCYTAYKEWEYIVYICLSVRPSVRDIFVSA